MTWDPGRQRILHLEDDALIALATGEVLRDMGFIAIASARTLEAAEAAVREGLPDVALLDVSLGAAQTALPLAGRLLEAGVPVVLATGLSVADIKEAEGDPRAAVLEKPFSSADLEAALRQVLD